MLIYVDLVTERLQFTLEYIFTQHGLSYRCTNDQREFMEYDSDKLNYSDWDPDHGTFFRPADLLFQEHIDRDLKLSKSAWEDTPTLSINGISDPFASIFYVLSRYEEYVSRKTDMHGRFQATSSILHQFGWLDVQIVEVWVEAIIRRFNPQQLDLLLNCRKTVVIPSFDIDNTFAYKWKKGWLKWLTIGKDIIRKNKQRLDERKRVNAGEMQDPYDTFDTIKAIADKFPQTRVFWHLADYGRYDRNIPWHDPRHQRLIRTIGQTAKIGLHPGYGSNLSDKALSEEQERIGKILGRRVDESRQHFLKLTFPTTYNRLMNLGFRRDFTMGYADHPGFRAGTAHTFFFFDLERNVQTNYEIVPFVYMDGTFHDYLKLSPEASLEMVKKLAFETQKYGGNFCFIWHNESIGTSEKWSGWSMLLEETLKLIEA